MGFQLRSAPERRTRPVGLLAVGVWIAIGFFASGCVTERVLGPSLSRGVSSPDVVGRLRFHEVRGDETLLDLMRENDLGYVEIVAANPDVDPWVPGVGTQLVLPTVHLVPDVPRQGIVVNLAEQRLYLFDAESERVAMSFPIGVSRDGWATPLGTTRVVKKTVSPIWYPTASARREDPTLPAVVRAGPENPLGTHALYLGWPRYLIHGTNEPDGVGRRVSRGCIRLYPEDIVRLFDATPRGAPVRVIHDPVKLGRVGREVYLEVHPTLDEMLEIEEKGGLSPIRPEDLRERIKAFAAEETPRVDWRLAYRVAAERRGIPVKITR